MAVNRYRKLKVVDPAKPGGVELVDDFGERGNPVFEMPLSEIEVNYEIVK